MGLLGVAYPPGLPDPPLEVVRWFRAVAVVLMRPVGMGLGLVVRKLLGAARAASVLLVLLGAVAAHADWRTLRTVDDATGKRVVLARANGELGHLSMLVTCEGGYLVLALGFDDHRTLVDGMVELQWDGGAVERHHLYEDDDGEVLYMTTWPGEETGGVRYDPEALRFFDRLRRHAVLDMRVRSVIGAVAERFRLAGAPAALDALGCSHR